MTRAYNIAKTDVTCYLRGPWRFIRNICQSSSAEVSRKVNPRKLCPLQKSSRHFVSIQKNVKVVPIAPHRSIKWTKKRFLSLTLCSVFRSRDAIKMKAFILARISYFNIVAQVIATVPTWSGGTKNKGCALTFLAENVDWIYKQLKGEGLNLAEFFGSMRTSENCNFNVEFLLREFVLERDIIF